MNKRVISLCKWVGFWSWSAWIPPDLNTFIIGNEFPTEKEAKQNAVKVCKLNEWKYVFKEIEK